MIETRYLIASLENTSVYLMTPSIITANALVSGSGDSIIKVFTAYNSADYGKITRNMFIEKVYSIDQKGGNTFVEMPDEHVSSSWKETRSILLTRQHLFGRWESFTKQALARQTRHQWAEFDFVAMEQIKESDPASNTYTWMLEEYARIVEMPVDRAYKELKLRLESDLMTKFRIQALAEKWKDKINQVTMQQQVEDVRREMAREFWQNSSI